MSTSLDALHSDFVLFAQEAIAEMAPAPKLVSLPPRLAAADPANEPWQKKVRRFGQSNMTEHDPAVMNIDEWADYWHTADADNVFISVTGILAFYPSKVQFHRHGKFLNGRDFSGECVAAAKKRNMCVVARMSPDLNWDDALGYAVHLLNYTNSNAHHGWMQSVYPLGPQTVSMRLPPSVKVRSVDLLRSGDAATFHLQDGVVRFTIPRAEDYEVAAITVA